MYLFLSISFNSKYYHYDLNYNIIDSSNKSHHTIVPMAITHEVHVIRGAGIPQPKAPKVKENIIKQSSKLNHVYVPFGVVICTEDTILPR